MPYLGNVPSSFNVGTDNINNDAITTAKIADGAILNADVNAAAAIAGTKISPDFGSQNILTTGTATAASLIPTSSTVPTNGLYLPATNSVALSTNGTGRLFINASGNVGVGTASPAAAIDAVAESTNGFGVRIRARASDGFGGIQFTSNDGISQTASFGVASNTLVISTASSERARIDSSGRLLVGTSSARSNLFNSTISPAVQVEGTTNDTRGIALISSQAASSGGYLSLCHQRSGAVGGNTILSNGDQLGAVTFLGSDGSEFVEGAAILAEVDGTPGANDMPSRLVFSTTADGASSPTERMRIDSVGRTLINFQTTGSGGTAPLQVRASDSGAWGINLLMRNSGNDYGYIAFMDNDASEVLGAVYCERSGASLGNVIVETNNAGGSTARLKIANNGQLSAVVPGSSTLYPGFMCRAWVSFNGGGTLAVRGSGGISSVVDSGVGVYDVNFSFTMPDTNYAVSTGFQRNATADEFVNVGFLNFTTVFRIEFFAGGAVADCSNLQLSVFR